MSSLIYGALLLVYASFQIVTSVGMRFYIDKTLWALVWGALFFLNGLFGGVYIQSFITNTLAFLLISCFLFGHQFAMFRGVAPVTRPGNQVPAPLTRKAFVPGIIIFVLIAGGIGMFAAHEVIKGSAASLASIGDIASYGATISQINGDIRTGLVEETLVGKIAFAAPQAALILIGIFGVLGNYGRLKWCFFVCIAALPMVAFTAATTVRSPTFIAAFVLFASITAGRTMLGQERALFRLKYLVIAGMAAAFLLMVLFIFASIRYGDYGFHQAGLTLEHLRIEISGYLPALNSWLWKSWDGHLTYGATTMRFLKGIGKAGGVSTYLLTVQPAVYIGNNESGNAATILRTVISDFGLLGSGVFFLFWGAISRFLLTKTRGGSVIFAIFFAGDLAAIFWSPNQWYFMYGSRILAFVFAVAYVLVRRIRLRRVTHALVKEPSAIRVTT